MKESNHSIIVVIGPTASGKSDLAIALAKQYDGEIISADSRQVYRGMDIGTGKVVNDFPVISNFQFPISNEIQNTKPKISKQRNTYISEGVRHHLLDVASPRREYNISHFLRDAKKAIADIERRGKTVIICGGTHFWVQALLTGETLPPVKPNKNLRAQLEKKSTEELYKILQKKDPTRAEAIDPKNPYRLIRALEIIDALGKVPSPIQYPVSSIQYPTCILALNPEKVLLREKIQIRLKKRFDGGMIEEVKRLRASGISWHRLESFGLEYRYIALFLQEKISEEDMKEKLFFEIWHYAKRQLSFIRRMEKGNAPIHWITDPEEALALISKQH